MTEKESTKMSEFDKLIGKVIVLYRGGMKTPARVIRANGESRRIVYDILGGPEKGKRMNSKFDDCQTAFVYDKDNEIQALLET